MAPSVFEDPTGPPTPADLREVLGSAAQLWSQLIDDVRVHAGDLAETWNFAGTKYGWSLRLIRRERVLVHMTPLPERLLVGVALGEKAIATARASGLASERTLGIVAAAPKYAEGRGVRFEVATEDDLAVAKELARIKLGR